MIDINQELSQNFIDFSYEANSQRAFADARDGLKPGQRACLWEMYSKGYSSNKPHVKCAKISGGTVASWWPHGTTAIYETFARMSQSWINNIPEVDWHGANGSIQISGEPAADRYCEARLSKSTEDGLFQGIKKNNVCMKLNFSEDDEWPEVLPAIYPRLLVNGCQGIGSTIANTWLPCPLDEIADSIINYLATGNIDYTKLAPSFPTGGIIINKNDLQDIFKTGKGKVVLRGRTEVKGNYIYITEMPYQVYVEPFIESVKQLIIKDELTGITNILNKSNKKSLLIEIECENDPYKVLNQLYLKTDLQKNYNANQYALVGKTPKLLTYKQYLDIYLQHNYDCICKEYSFDLAKSKKRLEIVEGLVKALEDIDNIISLIKKSDSSANAVKQLSKTYNFTETQANAIVNMKLGRLAHLEKIELNQERMQLTSTIAECLNVISNSEHQKAIYLERFKAFVKKYPNPRRTELTQATLPSKEEKEIEFVEPEKCIVVVTEAGTIKRIPTSSYKAQRRNGKGTKTQEDITSAIIRTNTIDNLLIFSNKGQMYRLLVDNIPVGTNSSKGQYIRSLVEMESNEEFAAMYSMYRNTDAQYVVFVTQNGLIKKTKLEEYIKTKKKTGIGAINLKEGDRLVSVSLVKDENISIITKKGFVVKFKLSEVNPTGRLTAGVKGINLSKNDIVVAALPVRNETDSLALFTKKGIGKKIPSSESILQSRGGRGLNCYKTAEEEGGVTAATFVSDEDNLLVVGIHNNICISAKELAERMRASSGTQVLKNDQIISVTKI